MHISMSNPMSARPVQFGNSGREIGTGGHNIWTGKEELDQLNREVSKKLSENHALAARLQAASPAEAAKIYKTEILGLAIDAPLPSALAEQLHANLDNQPSKFLPGFIKSRIQQRREPANAIFRELLKLEPASEG